MIPQIIPCLLLLICQRTEAVDKDQNFSPTPRTICLESRSITGCPDTSNQDRPLGKQTFISLFTRRNPDQPESLHECGGHLPSNTMFVTKNPTRVVIHGFNDGPCTDVWPLDMKVELLKREDSNVIVIDYSWVEQIYTEAVRLSATVAEDILAVITNIRLKTGASSDRFHLIGHSLGAQIAAYIGKKTALGRISALDAAGPMFYNQPTSIKLDKTDASFVDVIHTNAGDCFPHRGYPTSVGHIDFFVNGGSEQPHCKVSAMEEIMRKRKDGINHLISKDSCSHSMSYKYFLASINPNGCVYKATKCKDYQSFKDGSCGSCQSDGPNCAVMGFDSKKPANAEGDSPNNFYLDLSYQCPYCQASPEGGLMKEVDNDQGSPVSDRGKIASPQRKTRRISRRRS